MVNTHVKGRVLFENLIPIGNASVEVFDTDTIIKFGELPHNQTDSLGFLTTNENGWFEGDFDLAFGDLPRISIHVTKQGRSADFQLPPGEPQLRTNWPGPKRWLRHEDPDPIGRRLRAEARKVLLPAESLSKLDGATVSFSKPVVRLKPAFYTGGVIDVLATPTAMPAPAYLQERNAAAGVLDNIAAAASVDPAVLVGDRAAYKKIFDHVPIPSGVAQTPGSKPASIDKVGDGWVPDAAFAEQRIAGMNPMVIARVGSPAQPNLPTGFTLTDAEVKAIAGWTLAQLRDAGRLFVCDYALLEPVYGGFREDRCSGLSTVGLFYLADPPPTYLRRDTGAVPLANVAAAGALAGRLVGGGRTTPATPATPSAPSTAMTLMPLAIRLTDPEAGTTTTVKATDGAAWNQAKMALQANDLLLHELRFHLWNCHFAMEPVILAMARQLDIAHPLRELLDRHSYGAMWINNYGFATLVSPGGFADTLLGLKFDGVARMLADSQAAWSWNATRIKADIERRGLQKQFLPNFPYRDDGVALFDAVRTFTRAYVDVYYDNDTEVGRDEELSAWFGEMTQFGVNGLPMPTTRDGLADFLAEFIFQAAVQHAAVNTPQWDYGAYAANLPAYLRKPTGLPANASADARLLAQLPTMSDAIGAMQLLGQLALFAFEPKGLGHYRAVGYPDRGKELAFPDAAAEQAASSFRDAVAAIESAILNRNGASPKVPYDYLRPSRIDNATHK